MCAGETLFCSSSSTVLFNNARPTSHSRQCQNGIIHTNSFALTPSMIILSLCLRKMWMTLGRRKLFHGGTRMLTFSCNLVLTSFCSQVPGLRSRVRKEGQGSKADFGLSAADRVAAQLHVRANQQPSQDPLSCQRQSPPLCPHLQELPPTVSYLEESQLSSSHQAPSQQNLQQDSQHSCSHRKRPQPEERELSHRIGRLVPAVCWSRHYPDNKQQYDCVPHPTVKRRKVAAAMVSGSDGSGGTAL